MEEWKDIDELKGIYKISSLGRVKSLERTIIRSNGRVQNIKERIKKSGLDSWGYSRIRLGCKEEWKTYKVHRLVAKAFLGDSDKLEVNHKNGVKSDNRASNLEWVTPSENMKHSVKIGLFKPCLGENNKGGDKLTNKLVKEIRDNYNGESFVSIGKKYGISNVLATKVIRRELWKHV